MPAQTVCNYWNYWFTFLPEALSDRDQAGYNFRQALTNAPPGPVGVQRRAGVAGERFPARRMARSRATPASRRRASTARCPIRRRTACSTRGRGREPQRDADRPRKPLRPDRPGRRTARAASPATSWASCRIPGQPKSNPPLASPTSPAIAVRPTLFFDENAIQPDGSVLREFRDTRVPSRQP